LAPAKKSQCDKQFPNYIGKLLKRGEYCHTVEEAHALKREIILGGHMSSLRARSGAFMGASTRVFMRLFLGAVIIAAAATVAAEALAADPWPTRPIRVISPFPAGSASDTTSRVVLDQVSQILGQPMVIETKPGAGGVVGFADVAKADPDGYTIVVSSSSMGTGVVLHSHLPYDPAKDFVSVTMLGEQPNVLVASTQSGFKTVADLVNAAKAKPGTLTFASAGVGSSSHMAGERLRLAAKIDVRHVPFREGGLTEVMAGRIDYYFIPLAAAASALSSGKLNILAVSSLKRVALLPDVPSIAEAGYPNAEFRFWVGLSAPAKTPRAIIDKLHDATEKALQIPELQEKLAKLGVEPEQMSVDRFARFVEDDLASTLQLAKDAQIEPTD
jgi:tripartite-type tricarboxylate transporter receptor subunit TctC